MAKKEFIISKTIQRIYKTIFYISAFYFFLMGTGLIFLPNLLVERFTEVDVNTTIIGMLRGAGGSIIPYSLLYILIALDPYKRQWALYIIFLANVIAIILDFGSVIIGEYKLSYAMIDVPFEMMSITGIVLIFWTIKIKSKFPACFQTFSVLL